MHNTLSVDELVQVTTHVAFDAGWPCGVNGAAVAASSVAKTERMAELVILVPRHAMPGGLLIPSPVTAGASLADLKSI